VNAMYVEGEVSWSEIRFKFHYCWSFYRFLYIFAIAAKQNFYDLITVSPWMSL